MSKFPGYSQQDTNRIRGKFFEEAFERSALLKRFYCKKNELSARRVKHGRVQTMKSDLDFKVMKDGHVGFFDCKTFDHFFTYSDIDPRQIKLACDYNEHRVPAGFVVWFRMPNRVCYFSGGGIAKSGPRSRFDEKQGILLGKVEDIDLAPILLFKPQPPGLLGLELGTDTGSYTEQPRPRQK